VGLVARARETLHECTALLAKPERKLPLSRLGFVMVSILAAGPKVRGLKRSLGDGLHSTPFL
jgi:hypothetical protein